MNQKIKKVTIQNVVKNTVKTIRVNQTLHGQLTMYCHKNMTYEEFIVMLLDHWKQCWHCDLPKHQNDSTN